MWKNIQINIQNIEKETDSSVLIKCPNNSEYKGYSFWHPSKCVRSGKHSYAKSLGYTNEFTFKLKKYGKGKTNKFDVIDEIEIDASEFEEMFGVMNDNITEPTSYFNKEIKRPEKIEKEVKYNEDLFN